jgi:glycosyltransferase involved in cell wall biosynthesis
MSIINLHIYLSNFTSETRIFKETTSISKFKLADRIIMIGVMTDNLLEFQKLDEVREIHRIRLFMARFKKNKLVDVFKFIEFSIIVILKYRKLKPTYVNLHSFAVLPLSFFFKNKRNKVIYDTHELETEKARLGPRLKVISKKIERFLIRYVDTIVVVSGSIGDWYRNAYQKPVFLIRNIPNSFSIVNQRDTILRDFLNISESDILFIYQGLIAHERGIHLLLEAFKELPSNKHIVFMGFGELADIVKETSNSYKNIHFHEPVAYKDISRYSSGADVGFSIVSNSCLNHYYMLPNKLFEYIFAGIPVIVSDFPDMKNIVGPNNLGWIANPNVNSLAELINGMTIEDVKRKQETVIQNRSRFSWENEELCIPHIFNLEA